MNSKVYASISSQLRQLRQECRLSQRALGQLVDMAPERISILEDPNAKTKPNVDTLIRLADALEVKLEITMQEEKLARLTAREFYAKWAGRRADNQDYWVHPDNYDQWLEFAEAYAEETKKFAAQLESNIKFLNERGDKENKLLRRAAELLGDTLGDDERWVKPPSYGFTEWSRRRDQWLKDAGVEEK